MKKLSKTWKITNYYCLNIFKEKMFLSKFQMAVLSYSLLWVMKVVLCKHTPMTSNNTIFLIRLTIIIHKNNGILGTKIYWSINK